MAGARSASPSRDGWGLAGLLAAAALCLAAGALCLALLGAALAGPKLPTLSGRIVDEAGLLGGEDYAALNEELAAIEKASTDQVAVVTLKSLQGYTIEEFGYELGRHWGIGQKGKDNGLLLIVAPEERKVRIEVGYGLEPVMTDALSRIIIENAILPEFRRRNYAAGIRAGLRDIKDVLLGDAEAVRERARSPASDGLDTGQVLLLLFWLCLALYVMWAIYRSARYAQKSGVTRRRGDAYPGSYGGWDSGSSSNGGGGGWSGGGGSFGGGGATGSW